MAYDGEWLVLLRLLGDRKFHCYVLPNRPPERLECVPPYACKTALFVLVMDYRRSCL